MSLVRKILKTHRISIRLATATLLFLGLLETLVRLNPETPGLLKFRTVGAGTAALIWMFIVSLWCCRKILSMEYQIFAVARVTLEEALRTRLAIIFLVGIVLLMALLPLSLDPASPLRYRIQTFLSFGMSGVTVLLCLMTIFLASGGISGELEDFRIFNAMSKPVSRGKYLLGKWIGVLALGTLLLSVSGLGIFIAVRSLASMPAVDDTDRKVVDSELMVARQAVAPVPPADLEERIAKRWTEYQRNAADDIKINGVEESYKVIRNLEMNDWLSVTPMEDAEFDFVGLPGPEANIPVQFRFKLQASKSPPEGKLRIALTVNSQKQPWLVNLDAYEIITIQPKYLNPDGRMRLIIHNRDPIKPANTFNTTLFFPFDRGLEILYPVSSFGPNLARGLVIEWLKLFFLSALGVFGATFLSFPVASLTSLVLYVLAESSEFILNAVTDIRKMEEGQATAAALESFKFIFVSLGSLFSQFSRLNPISAIVEGRAVTGWEVLGAIFWIGIIYGGFSLLFAWLSFRRRELARN